MKIHFPAGKLSRYLTALLFIISLNFFLVHLMPGDPLVHLLGEETYGCLQARAPQQLAALGAKYGLDGPLHRQYFTYLAGMLRGDLGWSHQYSRPVLRVIVERLQWTLLLVLPALCISAVLGAGLGCFAGWTGGRRADRYLTPFLLVVYAVPMYCLGFLLLYLVAFHGGMAPLGGMTGASGPGPAGLPDLLRHMLLPLAVLVIHTTAFDYVIMRNSVRQIAAESYVLNALARGLPQRTILFRHLLPNALLPFITVVAMQVGFLFSGALLVEVVFSWHGMGTLIYEAVRCRDYPLLAGCFAVVSVCVVSANAAADLCYALIDPRVKDGLTGT